MCQNAPTAGESPVFVSARLLHTSYYKPGLCLISNTSRWMLCTLISPQTTQVSQQDHKYCFTWHKRVCDSFCLRKHTPKASNWHNTEPPHSRTASYSRTASCLFLLSLWTVQPFNTQYSTCHLYSTLWDCKLGDARRATLAQCAPNINAWYFDARLTTCPSLQRGQPNHLGSTGFSETLAATCFASSFVFLQTHIKCKQTYTGALCAVIHSRRLCTLTGQLPGLLQAISWSVSDFSSACCFPVWHRIS